MSFKRESSVVRTVLKVLVLGIDEFSLDSIRFILKRSQTCHFEITEFEALDRARALFAQNKFDVYIVNHLVGAEDGIEFVREVILEGCTNPIIIITGFDDSKNALRALDAGVAEYLSKDMLDSPFLERIVLHAIERAKLQRINVDQQAINFQDFKLSMLGRMSACIAHEINNPLALIIGELFNLQIFIQKNDLKKQEIIAKISRIEGFAGRIVRIIQSLTRCVRYNNANELEQIPIGRLVLEAVDLCTSKLKVHRVQIKILDATKDVLIHCNPTEISCVLVNLINNAVDAITTLAEKWIQIETATIDGRIVLTVTDSGLGLASETREQIFNPFFSTKKDMEGLGIGLNVSKTIVERYGGTLSVNAESKNTQFRISLPLKLKKDLHPAKVLVVDNDVDLVELVAGDLRGAGYVVKAADNGLKALDLLKSQQFEVLIVDLVIPGIRGDELIRQAAALNVLPVRVIGMTGFDHGTLASGFDESITQVLPKPFATVDLIRKIETPLPMQNPIAS